MGKAMGLIWVAVIVLAGLAGYVRLAPSDPARWHVLRDHVGDKDFEGGAIREIEGDRATLGQLDKIARSWPRTRVLSGSVDEEMVTYITRTALWGFPDYTTVSLQDGKVSLYARLRFGRRDFGVNRARIEAWLEALRQQAA
jgi:uncharacterized protein (DUF1499 family)